MRTKKGFTLVEILIVVVILGILAAIVIPQFSSASSEARLSSVVSNLQAVRSQIQLYKIQHGDKLPGTTTGVTFADALLKQTKSDGTVWTSGDTETAYGPYLQKIPLNPYCDGKKDANENGTVELVAGTTGIGDGSHAWFWDSNTGTFYADKIDGVLAADCVKY